MKKRVITTKTFSKFSTTKKCYKLLHTKRWTRCNFILKTVQDAPNWNFRCIKTFEQYSRIFLFLNSQRCVILFWCIVEIFFFSVWEVHVWIFSEILSSWIECFHYIYHFLWLLKGIDNYCNILSFVYLRYITKLKMIKSKQKLKPNFLECHYNAKIK